jgi:hypothetical protein
MPFYFNIPAWCYTVPYCTVRAVLYVLLYHTGMCATVRTAWHCIALRGSRSACPSCIERDGDWPRPAPGLVVLASSAPPRPRFQRRRPVGCLCPGPGTATAQPRQPEGNRHGPTCSPPFSWLATRRPRRVARSPAARALLVG